MMHRLKKNKINAAHLVNVCDLRVLSNVSSLECTVFNVHCDCVCVCVCLFVSVSAFVGLEESNNLPWLLSAIETPRRSLKPPSGHVV